MGTRCLTLPGCCVSRFIEVTGETSASEITSTINNNFSTSPGSNCMVKMDQSHPFYDAFSECKDINKFDFPNAEVVFLGVSTAFRDVVNKDAIKRLRALEAKEGREKGELRVGDEVTIPGYGSWGKLVIERFTPRPIHRDNNGKMVPGVVLRTSAVGVQDNYGSGFNPSTLIRVV